MNLIRIQLDPLKRETVKARQNPNLIHSVLENSRPGERTRILWRIDHLKGSEYLLVLAPENFNPKLAAEQFGYPDSQIELRSYQPLLERIAPGTKWYFRLAANPVHSKYESLSQRGSVKAHVTPEQQMKWLEKRSVQNGFSIMSESCNVTESSWTQIRKRNGNRFMFKKAVFEGVLTVTDSDLFKKALLDGIGREKAYGVGLLTIAPYHG